MGYSNLKFLIKLSTLKPNPNNPRIIKDDKFKKLVASIKDFPKMMALRPIITDENNIVLGGNMRLKALQELGYKELPPEWVKKEKDLTEEEKKEFIIKDNVGFGEWEWSTLANEWDAEQLTDWGLDIPGFDTDEEETGEDDYDAPEKIETDIKAGDLFQIGNHRLLCADSTDIEQVKRLMDGHSADMIFTDPPYELESIDTYASVAVVSKKTNILIFASDKQIPFVFESVGKFAEFKRLYTLDTGIASPTNNDVYVNHIALLRFKMGDSIKFNNIHNGGRSIVKTDYRKNLKEGGLHPHQKALDTLQLFIKYWSNDGSVIVDFFGGSGSTMVAAHRTGRICYMIEREPQSCQVIINRMKNLDNQLVTSILAAN